MDNSSYFKKRDINNIVKIKENLKRLPDFCSNFIIGIENTTSTLTRLNYTMDLITFFDFLKEYLGLKDITIQDLENLKSADIEKFLSHLSYYYNGKKINKNSESGKKRKLSTVKSLFRYLFNNDLISKNIASKVASPKIHSKEIIRLENNEIQQLFKMIDNPNFTRHQNSFGKLTQERDYAIILLFLSTGIRISELVGLNLSDFDFAQNAFIITRKGGNKSMLYFNENVANVLKNWIVKRENFLSNLDEPAMFLSIQKKRITCRAVENLVKKFSQQAAPLKNISPHKLRSTFGTSLYRKTKDIYIVADILGHKDVNTTKKHYAAINEDMRKKVSSDFEII